MTNIVGHMKREPGSFWDHNTEDFNKDICDVVALHLRGLLEEQEPYVRFEGKKITTKNPGWLDAALFTTDLIRPKARISPKLKEILCQIKNRIEVILNATKNSIGKEDGLDNSLHEMVDLYHDLILRIDQILV